MEPDPLPTLHAASCAISILAKAPIPGLAKTRLEPFLGRSGCARFQAACLHDITRKATSVAPSASTLAISPWPAGQRFAGLLPDDLAVMPQADGDLGHRIGAALSAALTEHPHALLLGSDSPDVPAIRLAEAIERLHEGADVVIGPAFDGGYYLLGVTRAAAGSQGQDLERLLSDLPWSTDRICAAQVERAGRLGFRAVLLDPWWDVDHPLDYQRLAERLGETDRERGSAVGAFVRNTPHDWLDRFEPDPNLWPAAGGAARATE